MPNQNHNDNSADNRNLNEESYLVKTVRGDENNFWRDFIQMITYSPLNQKKFPLRPSPKKAFTVDASGVHLRSHKEPKHTQEEKQYHSQLQSTTLVTKEVEPPLFGHNRDRKAKLVGVKMQRSNALLGRMLIYDGGTVNRPWDHTNDSHANEYYKEVVVGENAVLFDDEEKFKREMAKSKNKGKYNEVMARLKWEKGDAIIIGSDNLESRLLAVDYARTLRKRLEAQANEFGVAWDNSYQIPIQFYLPGTAKHLQAYDQDAYLKDIEEAKSIHASSSKRSDARDAQNYEYLLALDKSELIKTLTYKNFFSGVHSLIIQILHDGYIHILQSLLQKHGDFIEELKLSNHVYNDSISLLRSCARANQIDILKALIKADFGIAGSGRHPLLDAVEAGSTEAVKILLEHENSKTNLLSNKSVFQDVRLLTDHEWESALYHAARNGHVDITKSLLEKYSKPLNELKIVKSGKVKWRSALHEAAKHGHADIVELFLPYIPRKHSSDSLRKMHDIILLAAKYGHAEVIALLWNKSDLPSNEVFARELLEKANAGHYQSLQKLIIEKHPNLDTEANQLAGLKDALFRNDRKVFQKILKQIKINSKLAEAILKIDNEYFLTADNLTWLLENGLSIDATDSFDEPLIYRAFRLGDVKLVNLLLKDTIDNEGKIFQALLIPAVRYGTPEIVESVLAMGAKSGVQLSPNLLFEVETHGMLEYLLPKGFTLDNKNPKGQCFHEATDQDQRTRLFYAVKRNDHELFDQLINMGANIVHRDKAGELPIHHALRTGNLEMIIKFFENGMPLSISKPQSKSSESLITYAQKYQNAQFTMKMIEAAILVDANLIEEYIEVNPLNHNHFNLIFETIMQSEKKLTEIISSQTQMFLLNKVTSKETTLGFSRLLERDWARNEVSLEEKAKFIIAHDIEIGSLIGIDPVKRAEILIDIAYSPELPSYEMFMDFMIKTRKCADIIDLALENSEAAILLLNSHYGARLTNNDRVSIIQKWTSGADMQRKNFLMAIGKTSRLTTSFGVNSNALAYTLSHTWLFSSQRKTMDAVKLAFDEQSDKTFTQFFDELSAWCKREGLMEKNKNLQVIDGRYTDQKPDAAKFDTYKDAAKAHELFFLAELILWIKEVEPLPGLMIHHQMTLSRIKSEINTILSKEILSQEVDTKKMRK